MFPLVYLNKMYYLFVSQEGDRVSSHNTKSGAYAEFATAPCKHLIRLPDDFDFVKGAAVGTPYVTAYRALFQK